MDFADENPGAQVRGVDLSPIQSAYVPPNCIFEIDDINKVRRLDVSWLDIPVPEVEPPHFGDRGAPRG